MALLHFRSKELCKYCICLWVLNLNRVWPKTKSGPWSLKWATNSTSNTHIRKSVLSRMKIFAHYSLRPCNTNFVVLQISTIVEGKWLKYLWQNRYLFCLSTYFTFFTIKSTQVVADLISRLVIDNNCTLLYILYIFKILLYFNQAITHV